ncbi:hypothetical protein GCM10019059_06550 [Camelimonas fluminis]|uniref:AAA family ATPase n=1 Tax=Camelimonas fluminis TaxID=1576911 RepID=A0ABV7UH14_9HYPH|nr:AAA family ATPase [Camelimonas fluminis]GHE49973.1 hypothetical protein GCM10019059_06550 [Camelimonas fluminis]
MTNAQLKFRDPDLAQIGDWYYKLSYKIQGDVKLAPLDDSGQPAWGRVRDFTSPDAMDPADHAEASRWCILCDHILGCDRNTVAVIYRGVGNAATIISRGGTDASQRRARSLIYHQIVGFDPPANDNERAISGMHPSQWHGVPVPERPWHVHNWIPRRVVTMLSGDGGTGKSLLTLQVGVATVLGCETLGLEPEQGRVAYIGAEDEADEFQRRLADILRSFEAGFDDLHDDFLLFPLADQDATLAMPDRAKVMRPTPLFSQIEERLVDFAPTLIVLDTSADLFGGDEINRVQVRQFVGMLRRWAIRFDCAVVLLSHPSVTGMQSGTGTSGSTAWNNSVRSRLYLTAPEAGRDEPPDPDARLLTNKKANYGKVGDAIKLRWRDGVFVLDEWPMSNPAAQLLAKRAEDVFVDLLRKFTQQGKTVSPNPSPSYGPKMMAEHPDGKGISKKQFADAQTRLLDSGVIKICEEGSPSRRRKHLYVTADDYGPKGSD